MARTLKEMRWTDSVDVASLAPDLAARLFFGLNDYRLSDFTYIYVGGRTYNQQAILYQRWSEFSRDPDAWRDAHPGEDDPVLAAFPGTSKHGKGEAVDLLVTGDTEAERVVRRRVVATVLAEYGLWQAVRDQTTGRIIEWWHFEVDPTVPPFPQFPLPEEPPTPPINEDEDDMAQPLARIYGSETYDAQFILYANGAVTHLGPGEATMYDEGGPYASVPKVVETDRIAYHRLVRRSGTNWLPSDMPY